MPRELHLCDEHGFSLHEMKAGIQATTFNFTAYAHWEGFREHESVLDLEDMSTDVSPILDAVRSKMREHFRQRAEERDANIIEQWQREGAYPYPEGSPGSPSQVAERQVFDIVALTMSAANPEFERAEPSNKKMTLRLLQEAVERSPDSIHLILNEVAQLEPARLDELAILLESTDLSKIISSTRQVTDRLDFLHALEILLFENKSEVGETKHLHRILERELWLFGDHFESAISERGLTNVLREHIKLLGRDELVAEPVSRADGSSARFDIMLSAQVAGRGSRRAEHLVVELKAPSVTLGMAEFGQIQEYATAILGNERFDSEETFWEFWLIGNNFDDSLKRFVEGQRDRAAGLADHGDNYKIWVLRWNRVLEDHRRRLLFMREALEHRADDDASMAYLHRTHIQYLPTSLQTSGEHDEGGAS